MTSLSCSNATGSLLATLFHNWPHENLLQISSNVPEDEVTTSYNDFFIPKGIGDILPAVMVLPSAKLFELYCTNYKNLLKIVQQFKPDIIYTRIVGHPLYFTDICYRLAHTLKIPLVSHIMDDYERLLATSSNPVERYITRPVFAYRLRKVINLSKISFVISPKMAEAFSPRYNNQFITLHNGIDPDLWTSPNISSKCAENNFFRLVLAGALSPEKEGAIAKPLAQAIDKLNREGNSKYELILNTQEHYLGFAKKLSKKYLGITAQSYLPINEYRDLLQNADLLILARNFDKQTKAYTEYSFQNKLPEYMASGSPILCIGPKWENSIKFLQDRAAGETLTDYSSSRIQETIRDICLNLEGIQVLADRAKRIAFSEFNIHNIRSDFQKILKKIAGY